MSDRTYNAVLEARAAECALWKEARKQGNALTGLISSAYRLRGGPSIGTGAVAADMLAELLHLEDALNKTFPPQLMHECRGKISSIKWKLEQWKNKEKAEIEALCRDHSFHSRVGLLDNDYRKIEKLIRQCVTYCDQQIDELSNFVRVTVPPRTVERVHYMLVQESYKPPMFASNKGLDGMIPSPMQQ